MKLLTATSRTQGQRDNDFNYCTEGEVVINGFICDRDRDEGPDGGCGCGRSFEGLSSHLPTATAEVREVGDWSLDDLTDAVQGYLDTSGWGTILDLGDARELAEELIELAEDQLEGTIVERRLDDIEVRQEASQ